VIIDSNKYEAFFNDVLDYLSENDIKGLTKYINMLIRKAILEKGIPEMDDETNEFIKYKILSNYNKILKSKLQMRFVSADKLKAQNKKKNPLL
jgi:hypothetical protein